MYFSFRALSCYLIGLWLVSGPLNETFNKKLLKVITPPPARETSCAAGRLVVGITFVKNCLAKSSRIGS